MKTLIPKDILTQADGKFACGDKSTFEQREFRMPSSACENCMIELEYGFGDQKLFYCADVAILEQSPLPDLNALKYPSEAGNQQTDVDSEKEEMVAPVDLHTEECSGLCQN